MSVSQLGLRHNPIGVKGATAFADMLLKNKSLKELNLLHDSIGEEGAQKLIDSLTYNITVKELRLPGKYRSRLSIPSSRVKSKVNFSWADEYLEVSACGVTVKLLQVRTIH